MTHPFYNRNDGCVAFKGVYCVLPYPTLIRVRIEVLFCSKMFEGCYDRSLNWKWQKRTCWRSRCCMYFCRTRLWTYNQMMTVSELTHCFMSRCDDGVFTREIKHFLSNVCNHWWSFVILWCLYLKLSRCRVDSLLNWNSYSGLLNLQSPSCRNKSIMRVNLVLPTDQFKYCICIWFSWICE